jgi:hypothetical protein
MFHCVVWSIDIRVLEEPTGSYVQGGGIKMEAADSSRKFLYICKPAWGHIPERLYHDPSS